MFTNRRHCKELEDKGIHPKIARQMSSWDPIDTAREASLKLVWMGIICLVIGLVLISSVVLAKESESQIEEAMIACLNGKPFRAGIEYFHCERLGVL